MRLFTGALAHDKIIKKGFPYQFLGPISSLKNVWIPQQIKNLSKAQILYFVCADFFNRFVNICTIIPCKSNKTNALFSILKGTTRSLNWFMHQYKTSEDLVVLLSYDLTKEITSLIAKLGLMSIYMSSQDQTPESGQN